MERAIEIQGTSYPLKFGIGAYRILGRIWNTESIQVIMNKIQEPFEKGKEPGSLAQFDTIGNLTYAGIKNARPKGDTTEIPEVDDIIDDMMFASEKMEEVMAAFSENIPKQGNPQPRPKARKKGKA